jgi:hypothetical protein
MSRGPDSSSGTNRLIQIIISLTGALFGTVFSLLVFLSTYEKQITAEVVRGAPAEALIVSFIIPALADLAMLGGILWIISCYGFVANRAWAFSTGIVASVVSILAGFFPILPWISSGLGFPPTVLVFAVNLLFFIALQTLPPNSGKRLLMASLLAGITCVLSFINGVAGTHYLLTTHSPLFTILPPMNFVASFGWGATTVALVLKKNRAVLLMIGSTAASLLGGIPMAITTQFEMARPSLFWPSPILAVSALIFMFWFREDMTTRKLT